MYYLTPIFSLGEFVSFVKYKAYYLAVFWRKTDLCR